MKEVLYRTVYDEIRLSETQKRKILQELAWKQIKTGGNRKKRWKISTYAAACLCVFILSNVTIYAAVQLNFGEKIRSELEQFFGTKQDLTDVQKDVYTKYSTELNQEINLEYGTVTLESMICDSQYIFIPFTVRADETATVQQYSDLKEEAARLSYDMPDKDYFSVMDKYVHWDFETMENRSLHGQLLLISDLALEQGDRIRVKEGIWPDSMAKVVCGFSVDQVLRSRSLKFDAGIMKEETGTVVKKIAISPLSLQISGIYKIGSYKPSLSGSYIELKDGKTIKTSRTGNELRRSDTDDDGKGSFILHMIFELPVDVDDIRGIHLRAENRKEYWIPVHAEE